MQINSLPAGGEISPFGVDFEICNFVDRFKPKHTHYTLTNIQKVKKHKMTPLINSKKILKGNCKSILNMYSLI